MVSRCCVPELPAPKPPRRTGKVADIELTGMLMPWAEGGPVVLVVPASDGQYLPLFSSMAELERVLERADAEWETVKMVTDGADFFQGLPPGFIVMVDPYFTDEGKVRWFEVLTN